MPKREIFKDGQKVGNCFYVKDRPDIKPYTHAEFLCGECETNFVSIVNNVKKGVSCPECGRKRTRDASITHGESNSSKEYNAWINIKNRCSNENNPAYKNYGGRGIVVCDRWINSFESFLADMGRAPSKDHSIDRYPNNDSGNYGPDNCRWGTDEQQARNKRNNRYITYKGKARLLVEFAKGMNIPRTTLHQRIFRDKWSIEKAIETPVRAMKWNRGILIPHSFGFIN